MPFYGHQQWYFHTEVIYFCITVESKIPSASSPQIIYSITLLISLSRCFLSSSKNDLSFEPRETPCNTWKNYSKIDSNSYNSKFGFGFRFRLTCNIVGVDYLLSILSCIYSIVLESFSYLIVVVIVFVLHFGLNLILDLQLILLHW